MPGRTLADSIPNPALQGQGGFSQQPTTPRYTQEQLDWLYAQEQRGRYSDIERREAQLVADARGSLGKQESGSASDAGKQETDKQESGSGSSSSTARTRTQNFLQVFFLLSLVVNFYLGMLIRKLLSRYRALLSSVRSQAA